MGHGFSCSTACGIVPDQGSNPRPLHWQADFCPLHHQGSPQNSSCEVVKNLYFFMKNAFKKKAKGEYQSQGQKKNKGSKPESRHFDELKCGLSNEVNGSTIHSSEKKTKQIEKLLWPVQLSPSTRRVLVPGPPRITKSSLLKSLI